MTRATSVVAGRGHRSWSDGVRGQRPVALVGEGAQALRHAALAADDMADLDQLAGPSLLQVGDLVEPVDDVAEQPLTPTQPNAEVPVAEGRERGGELNQM